MPAGRVREPRRLHPAHRPYNPNGTYAVSGSAGVFVPDGAGGARFVPLPAPTDDDDAAICARVVRRIQRLPAVSLIHSCGRVGYVAITSATDACDGATVQFGLRRPAA